MSPWLVQNKSNDVSVKLNWQIRGTCLKFSTRDKENLVSYKFMRVKINLKIIMRLSCFEHYPIVRGRNMKNWSSKHLLCYVFTVEFGCHQFIWYYNNNNYWILVFLFPNNTAPQLLLKLTLSFCRDSTWLDMSSHPLQLKQYSFWDLNTRHKGMLTSKSYKFGKTGFF